MTLPKQGAETRLRIVSACVLGIAALGIAWLGGYVFAAVCVAAAIGVAVEWNRVTRAGGTLWLALGAGYAMLAAASPIVLRFDETWGFAAIIWLFAVVWSTDIAAYVSGRAIGGPKLCPRISPKKTWAGFIGGCVAGIAAGIVAALVFGLKPSLPVVLISLAAAVATHGGDLLESWVKRRFGVKDSSNIIPGHGGLMDRLDGFIAAGALSLAIGVIRAGWSNAGAGVLLW